MKDYQFRKFILGSLNLPSESGKLFYVSAFGHFDDEYKFQQSGKYVSNASEFPSITLKRVRDGDYDFCLRAKVISNSSLELYPTNCNQPSGIICRQKKYILPLCKDQAKEFDPMQLLMDPALRGIKKTMTAQSSSVYLELFGRLNKRAAFESLFR